MALLAGCSVTGGSVAYGEQAADGSFTIVGKYGNKLSSMSKLESAMAAEADQRCPGGWTKLDDSANPFSMSGGRVWRVACGSGATPVASTAAPQAGLPAARAPAPQAAAAAPPITAPVTAPAAQAPAPPVAAPTTPPTPPSRSVAAAAAPSPATTAITSSAGLVRLLTAAARRAGPYLTDDAIAGVVNTQLRDLAAAGVVVLGTDGQPIPYAP